MGIDLVRPNRIQTLIKVIFAPCIVRRCTPVHAQEQLLDVQKQAICVQTLIEDKLRHCNVICFCFYLFFYIY